MTAVVIAGACSSSRYPAAARSEWCALPVSRQVAIAMVMRMSDYVAPTDTAKAKLFGTDHWAVEVEGSVTPPFGSGTEGWAVFDIDAHSGDVKGMTAGPVGSAPSDWNALPDAAARCAHE